MKTARSPILSALLFTAIFATGLHGQAAKKQTQNGSTGNPFDSFQSFSAIMDGGIGHDQDRPVFRRGNLLRTDFGTSYRITDLQKLTMWGVQDKSCSEFAMPDAGAYPFSAYHDFKVDRAMTEDKETIDGHSCKIENVTFTASDGSPTVIKMKLWEAEDLEGFPIRIEAESNGRRMNIAYRNVSLTAPDAKLFSHPAKCAAGPQPGQKGTVPLETKPAPPTQQKSTQR